ncbi:DNA/RNA non-specific endonuclease [Mucilaginibacter arboris]|uniref:DNA/RNA non-specific endonuclease n=1 Tax=Mucilaginibacter arboris TaxID=2682090 RepID=A0A7K1SXL5_9SPHI|nr:DNA/RNA non-specific endonuclease [Mucilaginibacter arboris]MVN22053.1 DNA/RNA non-specific endonuclease [Mucilaginibacter arboris]
MYPVIAKYYCLAFIFITFALLSSCGGNSSNTSSLPVNSTSVSYGGNYHTVQTINEDFEQGHKAAYANGTVNLKTGKWFFADALIANSEADFKTGSQAVRIKNNGKISMLFEVEGAASVTLKHAAYGNDGASSWALFVVVNGDKTYKQTGATITSSRHTLKTVTFNIHKTGRLRFEIRKLTGGKNRINLDDFTITGTQDIKSEAGTSVSTGDTIVYTKPTGTDSVAANDNNNLLCGNPSGATADLSNYNNYLINQKYYTESYSRDRCGPNWVCWHLDAADLGSTNRLNNFRPDTKLPADWYEAQDYSYKNSGFDKGHNCPSGDRTNTTDANSATFLMDNIVPQAPYNNQRTWEHLEDYCRTQVQQGKEVYVMMGSYGTGGTGSKGYATTIDEGRINVPARIWKVAVIIPNGNNDLKRINRNTTVIAVDTPNDNGIGPNWMQYVCTIRDIEKNTGYNLLSSLPKPVQDAIEVIRFTGTPKRNTYYP